MNSHTMHRALALFLVLFALALTVTTLTALAPTRAPYALAAHTTTTHTTLAVEDHAVPREVWQGLREAGYRGVAGDGMEALYVPASVLNKALHTYGYTMDDVAWPLVHVVKTT